MARKVMSADEKKERARARREQEKGKKAAAALETKAAEARKKAAAATAEASRLALVEKKAQRTARDRERRAKAKAARDTAAAAEARRREAFAATARERALADASRLASIARAADSKARATREYSDDWGFKLSRAEWLQDQRVKRGGAKAEALLTRIGKIPVTKTGGVRSSIHVRKAAKAPRVGHVGSRGALKDGQARVVYNTDVAPHTRDVFVSKRSNFALKYGA